MKNVIWKIKNFSELNIEELYNILKARQEVFVVEQTCPYLDADGSDEDAIHIWAEKDGRIIAYCRVFNKGIKYPEASIGRVLTSKEARKSGLGKTLMHIAVNTISAKFHTDAIRISAQDHLLQFYSELGFTDTGKKYLEDDIPHTEMLRK